MTPTAQPTLTYHCPYCTTAVEAHPHSAGEVAICPACHQAFKLQPPAPCPPASVAPAIALPPGVQAPAPAAQAAPVAVAQPQAAVAQPSPAAAAVPAEQAPESPGELIRVSMWRRYPLRCLAYGV